MKKFKVTVNGKVYEVEVEEIKDKDEISNIIQTATVSQPKVTATQATFQPVSKAEAPSSADKGSKIISAPMPGTILDVKVKEGDRVKRGDVVVILEAMKMENEIMAPEEGVIASIHVSKGSSVNTG
ncbi:MAG: glutaconyl-CoA/methylmalonyl-CoA decarboxylase subunit gamma, partial [Thermoanaerobacter sp.]|nr:glutaconyl-CoA/methylmalonyl-CoA decarboxylase subunit gamma [Thermoanaerobacter sp.]